jgi:uncharacterized protein YbcV (DUF1398 family)
MFTLEQITTAHSKVRSGADFPAYIQEMKALGITRYDAFVGDGHVDYFGEGHLVNGPAKYEARDIVSVPNTDLFKSELRAHQEGKTDYPTFIAMCADTGVYKWTINMEHMTCNYFDSDGNSVLVEQIPQ